VLREELSLHRKRRKDMFDEFVLFQAEAGTGGRMAEYRRLIAAGCGGVPTSEVDNVVSMLLEVSALFLFRTSLNNLTSLSQSLESEEPSSSSAWSSMTHPSRPVPAG
jgi:transcription factor MBP1